MTIEEIQGWCWIYFFVGILAGIMVGILISEFVL